MVYVIYAKSETAGDRFGIWDEREYKTLEGAKKRKKALEKTHGKKKKYSWGTMPGYLFKVVKKDTEKKKTKMMYKPKKVTWAWK